MRKAFFGGTIFSISIFFTYQMNELFLPVIQGTSREQRQSILVSQLIVSILSKREGVRTELVDPQELSLPLDGNGDDAKDPRYTKITAEADGFLIVVPEYNHSFPGSLKRVLDSELQNYKRKPVAFAGVSAGPWGGVRAIQSLVQAVREMGLVATTSDVPFPSVQDLFDEDGTLTDDAYIRRVNRTIDELVWYARTLQWGRNNL